MTRSLGNRITSFNVVRYIADHRHCVVPLISPIMYGFSILGWMFRIIMIMVSPKLDNESMARMWLLDRLLELQHTAMYVSLSILNVRISGLLIVDNGLIANKILKPYQCFRN